MLLSRLRFPTIGKDTARLTGDIQGLFLLGIGLKIMRGDYIDTLKYTAVLRIDLLD